MPVRHRRRRLLRSWSRPSSGTNPLVPENTLDTDHDGYTNVDELRDHTDPLSIDLAFRADHAYYSTYALTTPTPDGRNCYSFTIGNIGLVSTQAIPNPPFADPFPPARTTSTSIIEMGFPDRLDRRGQRGLPCSPSSILRPTSSRRRRGRLS